MQAPVSTSEMAFLSRAIWWQVLLRGLAAAVFGLVVLALPELTLRAFLTLFGIFAIAYGVFAVIGAFRGREHRGIRWMSVVEGLAAIAVGVLTFVWPAATALVLVYLIAAWALMVGVSELVMAFVARGSISQSVLLGIGGLLSIAVGVLLALFPGAGALSLVILIGAYALAFGVLLVVLALMVRARAPELAPTEEAYWEEGEARRRAA